jgi:hypothetical protein
MSEKSKEVTLHSGRKVNIKRVPRYVLWRHGRTANTFQMKAFEAAQMKSVEEEQDDKRILAERGFALIESLSEDERQKLQAYIDDVIKSSTDIEDVDALSEDDYWEIFGRILYATPDAPIETKDGETDAQSVETFPPQSTLSGVS